jgi:hypothetical protein
LGIFWKPYLFSAGSRWCSSNQHHQIQLATVCLPHIRLSKIPNHNILTLFMATALFAETLDNFQHSMSLILESRICILNFSHDKLKDKNFVVHVTWWFFL